MIRSLLLSALVLLCACAPKEITISVSIVTSSCDPKSNPFDGVQFLKVKVTGDGLEAPLESSAATGGTSREIKIPQIPAGKNRVIEVRGYDGDPAMGAKTLSIGKSLPFEVLDVIPDPSDNPPVLVTVFLRKVNAFTPPFNINSPNECQKMKTPRAGHTATLLKNGKVLVAGGYTFSQGSTSQVALSDAEFFNPVTNSFELAPRMAISNGVNFVPKAFHSATLMNSGQVLLWGGETYTGGVQNYPAPSSIILVYDADSNSYGAVPNRSNPPSISRSHHQAAIDKNGKVLIVGGETRTMSPPAKTVPTDKVEFYDPTTSENKVVDAVSMPRLGSAAIAVRGGDFIGVAGGTDGTSMANEVAFFRWQAGPNDAGGTFVKESPPVPPRLADPGRRNAAVATLRDGADLLVLGGYSDMGLPLASSEIVATASSTVSPGPTIGSTGPGGRGDVCAVQLPDGKVLAIGGLTVDGPGPESRSDGSAVVISTNSQGGVSGIGAPPISPARYQHTCTLLPDGTVLVLGGLNCSNCDAAAGTKEILQDAWIYQPVPKD